MDVLEELSNELLAVESVNPEVVSAIMAFRASVAGQSGDVSLAADSLFEALKDIEEFGLEINKIVFEKLCGTR